MKILLVEDDAALGREIARGLREEHFVVDHAADGEDGLHLGSTGLYDAAVLISAFPKSAASPCSPRVVPPASSCRC